MDWFTKILDSTFAWVKAKAWHILTASIAFVLVGVLCRWDDGFFEFKRTIGHLGAPFFLVGVFLFILFVLSMMGKLVDFGQTKLKRRKLQKDRLCILQKLSSEEKGCLCHYLENDLSTHRFGMEEGVPVGLKRKDVLFNPLNVEWVDGQVTLNVSSWVYTMLEENQPLKDAILKCKRKWEPAGF